MSGDERMDALVAADLLAEAAAAQTEALVDYLRAIDLVVSTLAVGQPIPNIWMEEFLTASRAASANSQLLEAATRCYEAAAARCREGSAS